MLEVRNNTKENLLNFLGGAEVVSFDRKTWRALWMLSSLLQSEKKVGEMLLSGPKRSSHHETMEDHRGFAFSSACISEIVFWRAINYSAQWIFLTASPLAPCAFLFQVVLAKNIYKNS